MTQEQNAYIHCMLIPLQHHYLLLPNSTIAEVVPKTGVTALDNPIDNWLGEMNWREHNLPIIHLENMIKPGMDTHLPGNKLCILNSLSHGRRHAFYAIPCSGSPQLITLNESALKLIQTDTSSAYLHCQIQIGNKVAFIPNLDEIEMAIESHKQ